MVNKKNIRHNNAIRKPLLFFLFQKPQRSIKKLIMLVNNVARLKYSSIAKKNNIILTISRKNTIFICIV